MIVGVLSTGQLTSVAGFVPGLIDRRTSVQHFDQSRLLQNSRTMDPPQNQFRVPNIQFRVLIIGRANAGKTSVLQRVCDTTESPKVYRVDRSGRRSQVRSRSWWHPYQSHPLVRFNNLNLQLRLDRHILVRLDRHIQFLLAMTDHDCNDHGYSVAFMISTTNSFSKTTMVIFSTTPADSSLVVKMS